MIFVLYITFFKDYNVTGINTSHIPFFLQMLHKQNILDTVHEYIQVSIRRETVSLSLILLIVK